MSDLDLFCRETRQGTNTFLENDLFRARWDEMPLTTGHAQIVPKRHIQYFNELTASELSEMLLFVIKVETEIRLRAPYVSVYDEMLRTCSDFVRPHVEEALRKSKSLSIQPTAFNHGLNDGIDAGQSIPHFHYHIIPRWKGDVENPKGGIRRMFENDGYSNEK